MRSFHLESWSRTVEVYLAEHGPTPALDVIAHLLRCGLSRDDATRAMRFGMRNGLFARDPSHHETLFCRSRPPTS